jgi:adenylate cyclase
MEQPGRDQAVVFAEMLGAAELYAQSGDEAAHEELARSAHALGKAAAVGGARLAKTMGPRLMLLAPDPDTAALASIAMQLAASEFPGQRMDRLSLGVGFHYGPVIEDGGDVFGDTVNLAARLVEQAAGGQILLAAETAGLLAWRHARSTRKLYSIPLKGRSEEIELCELVWRADQGVTYYPPSAAARTLGARLTISYRGRKLVLQHRPEVLTIGREDDCGLVLADSQASRHHCSIQKRNGHFVVIDRSTNGTYVTVDGEDELLVAHDELTLRKRGWIAFGSPRGDAAEALEFVCD